MSPGHIGIWLSAKLTDDGARCGPQQAITSSATSERCGSRAAAAQWRRRSTRAQKYTAAAGSAWPAVMGTPWALFPGMTTMPGRAGIQDNIRTTPARRRGAPNLFNRVPRAPADEAAPKSLSRHDQRRLHPALNDPATAFSRWSGSRKNMPQSRRRGPSDQKVRQGEATSEREKVRSPVVRGLLRCPSRSAV